MPPTTNLFDNNFILPEYNKFVYGFFTGVFSTMLIYSILHIRDSKTMLFGSKIIRI